MKFCKDIDCKRPGIKLRLSEFPRDRRSEDGKYIYCKECCRRRARALRETRGARRYLKLQRKPMVITGSGYALSKVFEAIRSGCATQQAIKKATNLDYDSIGEALAELIFDAKAVRIQNRQFSLIGSSSKAA